MTSGRFPVDQGSSASPRRSSISADLMRSPTPGDKHKENLAGYVDVVTMANLQMPNSRLP
jgi:hypothetical protein